MTSAISVPDAATRARSTIAAALGIVSPSAVPLRDGRVSLGGRQGVLPAHVVRALDDRLRRRAADHARDERMLAEAVAILGTEIAEARDESGPDGATAALDRLLHVDGLSQTQRAEAEVMLRVALEEAAQESEEAAARLASLPGGPRPVMTSQVVTASQQINRQAQLLFATDHGQGERQRPEVVGRHRPASTRQTLTREVRGTGLIAGGRPSAAPELDKSTALATVATLRPSDLGSSFTDRPTIDPQTGLAVIATTASEAPQYIQVEIAPPFRGLIAQARLRTGTAHDPHVLRISPKLPDAQLRQVWVHQLSQMTQQLEAAKAGRPKGILGRLRSVFSHERRDRRLDADYAAYRLLAKDWHQAREETLAYGRSRGPRDLEHIEGDLRGLAATIKRRSGSSPDLPWAQDSIYSPRAALQGIAADEARRRATPAPHTPGQLRRQLVAQIATLQAAVSDLESQADIKATCAEEATSKGTDSERNKGRRHVELSNAYQNAASDAGQALAAHHALLDELDAAITDPDRPRTQIVELARQAAQKAEAYEASRNQALPVDDLETGVPTGRRLYAPVDDMNRMLAARGSRVRIEAEAPPPVPHAEYRRLFSPDGVVVTVGGSPDDDVTTICQVRLRMKVGDLTEVPGRDYELGELLRGTLGEGGQGIATTATHVSRANASLNLQPLMAMAPVGSHVQVTSHVVSPRFDSSSSRSLAETAGASAHFQHGRVDVHRGEGFLYTGRGQWEIEVRTSATGPWSAVETVDAGQQLIWVASPYVVKAATETVTLKQLGRESDLSKTFPRHTVTRISGVQGITDRLVSQARANLGPIDRIGYDYISGLITEDSYRLLPDMAKPGGLSLPIPVAGESEYELTVEVEPIWSTVELRGESSVEMGQEEVQVEFAGVSASQVVTTSRSGSVALAYPGAAIAGQPASGHLPTPTALSDVGSSHVDISPGVSAGRRTSSSGGQDLSATSITPVVHRYMGRTQGAVVDLRVTATLRKLSDPEAAPVVVTDTCNARLRLPENDLLRAGGPVDKNAVLRAEDGTIKPGQDGRALLKGDAAPPTGPQFLPPWHGTGENQLRGPGKSLVQDLEGAEDAQRQALTALSTMGLVPPLDDDYQPRIDALPSDQRLRAGQLANYDRIIQQINAPRIEAGINQACQGGLIVELIDQRTGHAPRYHPFRLAVTQDFDDVEPLGTSTDDYVVRLGIASDATQRMSGRSTSVPLSVGVGVDDLPKGIARWVGKLGARLSRTAVARNFGWSAGRRVNRVTLHESTGPVDKLRQGIRITFAKVTDKGDSELLADVTGRMTLAYDSALTRAEAPVFEAQPKKPHTAAIDRSMLVAVDAGNPADRIFAAVPEIRSDTSALLQLHTLLAPDSLVAHPDWRNGSYQLPMVITPPPANPAQALQDRTLLPQQLKVVIRGEAVSKTFAAISEQNTGDINFTMHNVGFTSGTSTSTGIGGSRGGPVDGDDSSLSTSEAIGRTTGTSQLTTSGQTTGEERLAVHLGKHYEFIERYELVADIMQGDRVMQTVPLDDALAQSAMPERRALELYGSGVLDLPPAVLADVDERYRAEKLDLEPRTAVGFERRYEFEKTDATTDDRAVQLTDMVRAQSGIAESTASTPQERLQDTLVRAQDAVTRQRAVGMPDRWQHGLAASQVDSIAPLDDPHARVELLNLFRPQIDELAPGHRAANPLLEPALQVDLGRDSYRGPLDNMFGQRGYLTAIELPVDGQQRPDVLLLRTKARGVGPIMIDDVPEISKVDTIGLRQNYKYEEEGRSISQSTAYSFGLEIEQSNSEGGTLTGGVATSRVRQVTSGSGRQNTTLDRTGHFDMAKVRQEVVFTTEVIRLHNPGAAELASGKWWSKRIDPAIVTTVSEPRQLRTMMTTLVPRKLIRDAPTVDDQQAVPEGIPEHRAFEWPASAVAEQVFTYGKGDKPTNQLFNRLCSHLSQPEELGEAGVLENQLAIETQLMETALKSNFKALTSKNGFRMEPMTARGNGQTTRSVVIHATPLGWNLDDDDPLPDAQTGTVERGQKTTSSSTTGNYLLPPTVSVGSSGGIISVSGSVGDQVKEQSSSGRGTRLENTKFENGDVVTVRIPVVYDITVHQQTDKGRGKLEIERTTHLPGAAKAQYFVTMLKHEYLERLRQMETGDPLDLAQNGGRLPAVRTKLGKPDMRATEYAQDASGQEVYQPYQPLLDALLKAKLEGRTVVLAVREADGCDRRYVAFPGGMEGVDDGGFAAAFAKLHPTMVKMAEGRVDLRKLYNTSERGGSFSTKVAAELEQNGVPTSMLKGLDYATTVRAFTKAPEVPPQPHPITGGWTITPTTHGPSLGAP
ncbi:hypothetical protein EV651_1341 [Kribbella sp. VKM Ac-2571]|uniref:hypothetical protein n=1 Tax=Kribbella sp. VKM Ac-2571 TaxID=2512222 RepID=UPI00105BC026|nr:hypothetical protein [Kribbella sp. VKM Ac-2571]TDO44458.1 hypothetical protein EV651_1341 [Kribbella sp. VKM Ac-2571]